MSTGNPMEALEAELPNVMKAFRELRDAVAGDGALPARTKKLIMIGIAVAIRCEPCIRMHVAGAKEMGISREEILEAAGVAVLLGGGPAAAYSGLFLLDELNA
jgi:AhpD family alkylhydroperoxidase